MIKEALAIAKARDKARRNLSGNKRKNNFDSDEEEDDEEEVGSEIAALHEQLAAL